MPVYEIPSQTTKFPLHDTILKDLSSQANNKTRTQLPLPDKQHANPFVLHGSRIMAIQEDALLPERVHNMASLTIQVKGCNLHYAGTPTDSSADSNTNIYISSPLAPKAAAEPSSIIHNIIQGTYFHKFPELAVEIRLKIWNEALKFPRTAHLRLYDVKDQYGEKTGEHGLMDISRDSTPLLFRVCQESRAEALKTYRFCFGRKPQTYFNYDNDCVYLDTQSIPEILQILDTLSLTDLTYMRRVTMKVHDWADAGEAEFRERFWRFSSLGLLELLLGDGPFDGKYMNRQYTASCIKDELRGNRRNRPMGWKVPKVSIQIIENFLHREVGAATRLKRI